MRGIALAIICGLDEIARERRGAGMHNEPLPVQVFIVGLWLACFVCIVAGW